MTTPKTKIIHIIHRLEIGGAEVAVRASVDKLNEVFNFEVITLSHNDADFVQEVQNKQAIKVFNLHSFGGIFNLIRLLWYLSRQKPEIVITSLWKSHAIGWMGKILGGSYKLLPVIHSSCFFHRIDDLCSSLAIKSAKMVVCDSRSSESFIKEKFPDTFTSVVSFLPVINPNVRVQNREETSCKAVFVGRITAAKRLDRALSLIQLLKQAGVNVTFDIYGPDHGQLKEVTRLIETKQLSDLVKLFPAVPVEQVVDTLSSYQLFLQLSDVEGMAMSVVQAMQTGLIPVVTKVGEMQFYVKHLENGVVVPYPFDELTATVSIIKTICENQDLKHKLRTNALSTFYGMPDYPTDLERVIRECIEA